MLFAEGSSDLSGVAQWALVALSTLGALGTAWINRLATRDKLQFDHDLTVLKAERDAMRTEIDDLRRRTEECHEERAFTSARYELLEIRCAQQQHEIDDLRRRLDDDPERTPLHTGA